MRYFFTMNIFSISIILVLTWAREVKDHITKLLSFYGDCLGIELTLHPNYTKGESNLTALRDQKLAFQTEC